MDSIHPCCPTGGRLSADGNLRGRLRRHTDVYDMDVALELGDKLIERAAERAAELIAEREVQRASDGWLRGADKIATYIDAPRSRVYALVSARRIPVHHDGSALIARRSELDAWLLNGGGRRS